MTILLGTRQNLTRLDCRWPSVADGHHVTDKKQGFHSARMLQNVVRNVRRVAMLVVLVGRDAFFWPLNS